MKTYVSPTSDAFATWKTLETLVRNWNALTFYFIPCEAAASPRPNGDHAIFFLVWLVEEAAVSASFPAMPLFLGSLTPRRKVSGICMDPRMKHQPRVQHCGGPNR